PIGMTVKLANCESVFRNILSKIDTFLFDCDGVLWQGNIAVKGAPAVVAHLKSLGKQVCYVTNNSTKSRHRYVEKLTRLGFPADVNSVFSTAYTSALYLKNIAKVLVQGKVYLVGNPAMAEELDSLKIQHFGSGPDNQVTTQDHDEVRSCALENDVSAVLVGYDGHISYTKMIKAASYLNDPKCLYVATNEDHRMPLNGERHVVPGTGCVVASVTVAAGRNPDVIAGKPGTFMLKCIQQTVEIDPTKCMMVGDRMNTDILFGNQSELHTLLVLSGVEDQESLNKAVESSDPNMKRQVPEYCMGSIGDWYAIYE
uniref:Phosphoglycolate phosphatase n=1 Tax=Ciona intestinalis TaxID=7719 RepID=F6Q7P2_CIOIN